MTTRGWLVRVRELEHGVERRDRVIVEQRRMIRRRRELVDAVRTKLEHLEAEQARADVPRQSASTPRWYVGQNENGIAESRRICD